MQNAFINKSLFAMGILMSVNYTLISSGVHSHWVMSVNNTPVTDSVHSHYPFGVNLVGFHTKSFTVYGSSHE